MSEWFYAKCSQALPHPRAAAVKKFFSVLGGFFGGGSASSFKKLIASLVILAECFGCVLFGTPVTPSGDPLDLTGYNLVLSDDFERESLDTDVWLYRADGPRRCGFNSPLQNRIENGNLVMTAEYRDGVYGEGWYSAMIRTKAEFTYGYFEISCKVGDGDGFWSAFWLNSIGMGSAEASDGGRGGAEIDIFESTGLAKNNIAYSTVHVGGYGDGLTSYPVGRYKVKDIHSKYNTYGLKWTPDEYIFYINGVESGRLSEAVSQFFEYVIISLEHPSAAPSDTDLVVKYYIDYVRVYQLPDQASKLKLD